MERYTDIIEKMSSIVNFPFSIIDSGNNVVAYKPSHVEWYVPQNALEYVISEYRKTEFPEHFPYFFVAANGIFAGVVPIYDLGFVIVGPVLSRNVNIGEISDKYANLFTRSEFSLLRSVVIDCQKAEPVSFSNVIAVIYELIYNEKISGEAIIRTNYLSDWDMQSENTMRQEQNAQSRNRVIKEYFFFENSLFSAIESGDREKITLLWNTYPGILLNNVPPSFSPPIFMGLPALAVMRRAAILGGAGMEEAFAIYDHYADELMNKKTSVDNHLIVTEASYVFQELVEKKSNYGKYSVSMQKCIQYIHSHISEKITIADLSYVCGQSTRQVSRIFEHCLNSGVSEYITFERIKQAKEIIASTNTPIVEIGNNLGFASQSYFTKIFSQYVGCTPKEYRIRSGQL